MTICAAPAFTVRPNNSRFEFAFALPAHLPSTFAGAYGKCKYDITFTVHRPWAFDETVRVPLVVRHALDLNAAEQADALRPYQRQQTRVVGMLSSGPVSLHVYAMRCGCATGDRMPIQVSRVQTYALLAPSTEYAFRNLDELIQLLLTLV